MRSKHLLSACLVFFSTSIVRADWTVTVLQDPNLNQSSIGLAVSETTVFGWTTAAGLNSPTSWSQGVETDWSQDGMQSGFLLGTDGFEVTGQASFGGELEAILFRGNPANLVRLQSPKTTTSRARSTWGGTQVGVARYRGDDHASIWRGTAKSWRSLHPRRYQGSEATTIINDQVGGTVYSASDMFACAWEGQNLRFRIVDNTSSAIEASNASFYGGHRGIRGSNEVAYLWAKGSNAAFNIAPPDTTRSWVTGMDEDKVAITSTSPTYFRRAWVYDTFNSVTPWTDLQAVLDAAFPGTYSACEANAIWRDPVNNRIRVAGRVYRVGLPAKAVVWEYTP